MSDNYGDGWFCWPCHEKPMAQADIDRERVEAAGYPEGIDYEALILAEDEDT